MGDDERDAQSLTPAAPTRSWRTLQASGHAWIDRGLAREALVNRRPSPRGPTRVLGSDQLGEREEPWELWRDGTSRTRSEYTIGTERITVVADARRWWRSSKVLGSTSGSLAMRPVALLLGPPGVLVQGQEFLEQLQLERTKPGTVAGRVVNVVTGRPTSKRTQGRFFLRDAGVGADYFEVSLDAETGVALAVAAYRKGQLFRLIEVTSIDYDVRLAESTFAPPTASSALGARGRGRERVDLGQLELREQFTVLLPVEAPSTAPPHLAVFDGDRRGPGPERLVVTYAVNEPGWGRGQLRITESAHELTRSLRDEWRTDGNVEVSEISYGRVPRRRVRAQRYGTYVELDSTVVPLEELRALLATLEPVAQPLTPKG